MRFIFGLLLLIPYNLVDAVDPDLTLTFETIDRPVNTTDDIIKLRYLSNNAFSSSSKSPLLIHLTFGNDVTEVANEQKFIFSIAQQLKASVHFVEHRYFGKSKVNPADTYTKPDDFTDFNAISALEDFKAVINELRNDTQKVILSGAGYAGQLAAILQMKDSENIYGSIISNAPLYLHQGGGVELGAFDKQLNKVYKNEGCLMDKLKAAFDAINGVKNVDEANKIVAEFNLISSGKELFEKYGDDLQLYLHRAYIGLVYQNFDRNSSLNDKQTFESRPVKTYCDEVSNLPTGTEIEKVIAPLQLLIEHFYQKSDINNRGKHIYNDLKTDADIRKRYIECTSNVPYHCNLGSPNDYFKKVCDSDSDSTKWITSFKEECATLIAQFDDEDTHENTFNELTNIFNFTELKNVIYIDGENDPNQVGAVNTVDNTENQYKFLIPRATKFAHLLPPTTCDPDNIKQLRYRVINLLKCWINEDTSSNCESSQFTAVLPDYAEINETFCEDQLLAYPWNQDISYTTTTAHTVPIHTFPGGQTNPSKMPQQSTKGSNGQTVTKDKSQDATTHSLAPSSVQLLVQIPFLLLGTLIFLF